MREAARSPNAAGQAELFERPPQRWVEVDFSAVRVDGTRNLGGPWLALQLIGKLGLKSELDRLMPPGREEVPWSIMALVLVICRLCDPSSELRIAEHLVRADGFGGPAGRRRQKRSTTIGCTGRRSELLHKEELEKHLKNRLGELFSLSYDLLYDVASTYFEDERLSNDLAQQDIRVTAGGTASRSASRWW